MQQRTGQVDNRPAGSYPLGGLLVDHEGAANVGAVQAIQHREVEIDQQAARRIRSGGAIINLSSSVLQAGLPTFGAYTASKGAVEALTLILARELKGRDVTVNAVAPGQTATDTFLSLQSEAEIQRGVDAIALGRLAQPADIANVVAFLAGPDGHWINGQVIRANGGLL